MSGTTRLARSWDLARRRTEFLFHVMRFGETPLHNILASAYLQGCADAGEAIHHRAEKMAPSLIPWQC
ncbi:hypothetical protein [Bradyrhizobium cenepequi]|uniref:hypothetical protein n=1 Tax=Bradyrhizobium cenepequi TaxID=2821403 RepID=UPI001CE274A7|nr:hypothetical protein [Bradyrhizobium cenepequi]MCA6108072.1 hypothetical protein [Bradyrhizobium cenepequi]